MNCVNTWRLEAWLPCHLVPLSIFQQQLAESRCGGRIKSQRLIIGAFRKQKTNRKNPTAVSWKPEMLGSEYTREIFLPGWSQQSATVLQGTETGPLTDDPLSRQPLSHDRHHCRLWRFSLPGGKYSFFHAGNQRGEDKLRTCLQSQLFAYHCEPTTEQIKPSKKEKRSINTVKKKQTNTRDD